MAVVTWVGGDGSGTEQNDSSRGANWSTGSVPGSGDYITIANVTHHCILATSYTWSSLEIETSAELEATSEKTITIDGEASNYGVTNVGTITGVINLILTFYASESLLKLTGASGKFNDVTVNHASAAYKLADTCVIDGDLTITAGSFDTGSDRELTVAGTVNLGAGDLLLNASAVTIGGFNVTGGGEMTGTTHANGTIVLGNWRSAGSRFNNADGKVVFKGSSGGTIAMNGAGSTGQGFYDVEIDISGQTYTVAEWALEGIENNLTITAGTLTTGGSNLALTVGSWINGNGTFEGNASTIDCGNGVMCNAFNMGAGTINTGNDFRAGTSTFSGDATVNCDAEIGGRIISTGHSPTINAGMIRSTLDMRTGEQGTSTVNLNLTQDQLTGGTSNDLFFYNLELDSQGTENNTYTMQGAITCTGDLTITDGVIDTGSDHALTVTAEVNITGTLTGNESAISMRNLVIAAAGTYSATNQTTTITGEDGDGDYAIDMAANGTFTHNNGNVIIEESNNTVIRGMEGDDTSGTGANAFYRLQIAIGNASQCHLTPAAGTSINIVNNVSIAEGILRLGSDAHTLTIGGDLDIESGGQFGLLTHTGAHTFGSLTIASGGIFIATTGQTTMKGNFANSGTFTNNEGKMYFEGPNSVITGTGLIFYDLDCVDGGSGWTSFKNDFTVENELDIQDWKGLQLKCVDNTVTLTMGTATAQGEITMLGAYTQIQGDNNTSNAATITGVNSLYPAIITQYAGTTGKFFTDNKCQLANVNVVNSFVTLGSTSTLTLTGDCEFDAVTIAATDTLDLNENRVEIVGTFTVTGNLDQTSSLVVLGGTPLLAAGTITGTADWIYNADNNPSFNAAAGTYSYANILSTGDWNLPQNLINFTKITNFISAGSTSGVNPIQVTNMVIPVGGTYICPSDSDQSVKVTGDFNIAGGLIGKSAAVFDGSQSASFGDPSEFEITDTLTIEAWLRPESTSGLQGIIGKVQFGGVSNKEWGLSSNDAKWFFKMGNGTTNGTIESDENFVANKWYHLVCTKDSSGVMRMYVNGKQQTTIQTVTGDCNPTFDFIMGRRASSADLYYTGTLGLVRIFNTERTVTQIRTDMFNDFSNMDSTTGLVACYQFDTGTGTTIYDSTSNDLDSSSSDATWAGAGGFTDGTSTLDFTGNGSWYVSDTTTEYYNVNVAASGKTTTMEAVGAEDKRPVIMNLLTHGGGTLTDVNNCSITINGTGTISSGADLSGLYFTRWLTSTAVPSGSFKYLTLGGNADIAGDITANGYIQVYGTTTLGDNLTITSPRVIQYASSSFTMGVGTIALTSTNGWGPNVYDNRSFSAGPGAVISGSGVQAGFASGPNWIVVGKCENLDVTNGELSVTGQVINCTGDIIQQHPSIDANQQLDYDTADDRDIHLGRDLDMNTELVT